MELNLGKLFIGGISWDTDENKLKEYFGQYGEVVEAVIMRDRVTGRARGFGFIVFADSSVAERVVMDKHMVDGRTVEAKKAVPRDDQQILNRKNNMIQGSPSPGRTKKIFVGGLASTITENDFKNYFDQFGIITDVVVMYDHNTQRPRGFGFITYDSEDSVDRVLNRTFHELNGKTVEVKRAVPKELSAGPTRSPIIGYNRYGMSRASNLFNDYGQGYNLNSIGGYGRLSPIVTGRTGIPPFGNPGYGIGVNMDPRLSANSNFNNPGYRRVLGPYYNDNSNFNNPGYRRVLGPYYNDNSNRYNTPIGYNIGNSRGDSLTNPTTRNVWANGSFNSPTNPPSPGVFSGSGSGNFGPNSGPTWGMSSTSSQGGGNGSGYSNGNLRFGFGDGYGSGSGGAHRRTHSIDSAYEDLYNGSAGFGDLTWPDSSVGLDGPGSFGFGLGNGGSDIVPRTSEGLLGSFNVTNRPVNRGIAA